MNPNLRFAQAVSCEGRSYGIIDTRMPELVDALNCWRCARWNRADMNGMLVMPRLSPWLLSKWNGGARGHQQPWRVL